MPGAADEGSIGGDPLPAPSNGAPARAEATARPARRMQKRLKTKALGM
jgi:hypothetical protein